MEFNTISMKQRAKALIKQIKPSPMIIGLISGIICWIEMGVFWIPEFTGTENFMLVYIAFVVVELITINIKTSFQWYGMKIAREENPSIGDMFLALKEKTGKVFCMGILKGFMMFLGACFCGVGALLVWYWFRFSSYVLKDNENIGVIEALIESKKLLKGHYLELIKLDISNLGWYLLPLFTLYVGAVYTKPYLSTVYAEYYDFLKGQKDLLG